MLASITPLGERGRQARWGITIAAFLAGATLAGALAGALAGFAGSVALPSGLSTQARLSTLGLAALLALALDLAAPRVPGPRRQVDQRWRDRYRGWVYGLGYGAQLGLGVTTIVSSAATYVMLVAAVLSGSAGDGALIVGLYGALRGATPLAAAPVKHPEQLLALHRGLLRWRAPAARLECGLLGAIVALALVGALT
jgi:hypothetical protein